MTRGLLLSLRAGFIGEAISVDELAQRGDCFGEKTPRNDEVMTRGLLPSLRAGFIGEAISVDESAQRGDCFGEKTPRNDVFLNYSCIVGVAAGLMATMFGIINSSPGFNLARSRSGLYFTTSHIGT